MELERHEKPRAKIGASISLSEKVIVFRASKERKFDNQGRRRAMLPHEIPGLLSP
ncbi:hypothetical protein [Bathymodiolus platifrons methanotrophic gill symbiont]|uniref:hypothetical protein n=1 Tax=Bathymodiolus platifrons methanotrophic gill symbiont TaxID=113268 RepID=UPI001C8EB695|nr:hypothetical protein [Bathymodiolus platifrons methanotrophic gill symbiont]